MSELVDIVNSLEDKVSKLLQKLELLDQTNARLHDEINLLKEKNQISGKSIIEWEDKYNSLKLANTMLGSNTHKTETKLKINTLIRELDSCIAQLAE